MFFIHVEMSTTKIKGTNAVCVGWFPSEYHTTKGAKHVILSIALCYTVQQYGIVSNLKNNSAW